MAAFPFKFSVRTTLRSIDQRLRNNTPTQRYSSSDHCWYVYYFSPSIYHSITCSATIRIVVGRRFHSELHHDGEYFPKHWACGKLDERRLFMAVPCTSNINSGTSMRSCLRLQVVMCSCVLVCDKTQDQKDYILLNKRTSNTEVPAVPGQEEGYASILEPGAIVFGNFVHSGHWYAGVIAERFMATSEAAGICVKRITMHCFPLSCGLTACCF